MKLRNFLFAILFLSGAALVSCDSKDEENDDQFSPLTVEQNKANLENTGIDMITEMQDMTDNQSVTVSQSLISFLDINSPFGENAKIAGMNKGINAFLKPVMIVSHLKDANAQQIARQMQVTFDDPESLQEIYDSLKGLYSWNNTTQSWDISDANEIRFEFPSTENGTDNNATFRIYDYLEEAGPFNWTEDYTGNLPKQIKSELKVDNTVLITYSVNITYENADKMPNSIVVVLGLPPFAFTWEAANQNNADASVSFKFTKNDNILLMISLGVLGNWNEDHLNSEDTIVGNYISSGNALFQVMNIKVVGTVDVKNLEIKIRQLEAQYEDDTVTEDSIMMKELFDVINQYVNLSVRYVDNNQIIALMEAYPEISTETYYYWEYNYETHQEEQVFYTETTLDVNFRFRFSDNSTVDAETYFNEGFDALINSVDGFLTDMEDQFGGNGGK